MKPYHLETVKTYANRWRGLLAWGAQRPAEIEVEVHTGGALGRAKASACAAIVYCTGDLAVDLATAVHELAHLAAPDSESHGKRWKEIFARGAAEAFECDEDDFDTDVNYLELDAQVEDMARVWLESQ